MQLRGAAHVGAGQHQVVELVRVLAGDVVESDLREAARERAVERQCRHGHARDRNFSTSPTQYVAPIGISASLKS